jgi:carboxylesterase
MNSLINEAYSFGVFNFTPKKDRSIIDGSPLGLPMSLVFSLDLNKSAETTAVSNDEIVLSGNLPRTVILLHGLTGTPNEMRHLAFYLNKRGYNVICPRLANHGQPLHIIKHTKWEEIYGALREVFLQALGTGNKVYVAGLSMSALFVLLLAEEFGEKLAGGICLSPTLFFDGWNIPWFNWLLPLASYSPLKYALYFKEGPPYGIKNEKIRGMVHRYYSKAKLDDIEGISKFGYAYFPVSLFYQLRRLVRTVTPLLGKVNAPILLIHPQDDDTASIKNSQFIYDRVASKTKKLVILKDSYHVITADQERETVAREMKDFIETI